MSDTKNLVTNEEIQDFLEGSDSQKYIVAVEANQNEPSVTLIINDPDNQPKYSEVHKYKPFIWFKENITKDLYGGNRIKIIEARNKYGITFKKLRTSNSDGFVPKRLEDGFTLLAETTQSFYKLIRFFSDGGIDVFNEKHKNNFIRLDSVEQFLIQSGKRLFKGMDDYNDIHRFQFDLETEGLYASKDAIFQIGVRDNRGIEMVLETLGNSPKEKRDSERINIEKFFKIIDFIKPDVITGYNSENFDWPYLFERSDRLGIPVSEVAITLNRASKIKRKSATIKLGGDTEKYEQTHMYGYSILDISHAVRRAMAVNTEIRSWGLKYITQYSGIAKPNRVYVPGDLINTTWSDKTNQYAFNESNGIWYKITDKNTLKDDFKIVTGAYIVQRYLCDDLWETEQIDNLFNQASFLISKMLPTTFMRSSTMGTAGQWKLIMLAWSYQNGLAIPEIQTKRDFTGGLSRLLEVGFAKNVVKLDFAALYPKTQLTWDIFPDLDISGVMKGILTYIVDTRDHFKFLTGIEKSNAKKLEATIDKDSMTDEEIQIIKSKVNEHKKLSNLYDKKQLPLKILANSWFGSYGSLYFNWGDTDSAEETTCRGRQYLRLMVRHFTEKYGFKPLVGDSVTYDTPVYIRYDNSDIDVKPICDLFNEDSDFIDPEKLRDFEQKPYEVLTVNGWKKINYVFRHGTDKEIHRVITKDKLVQVTEDHSLFQNKKQVKPSILKRGDKIDVYNEDILNKNLSDISFDKAWLMGFFLSNGFSIYGSKKQYYKSKKTDDINKETCDDWKISNTNLNFLEKFKDILECDFFVKAEIKNDLKSSGVYNLVVSNSVFVKYFSDNFYTSYRDKKIPMCIFNSNKEIKMAFINGVFASDGYGDNLESISDIAMKSQVAMAGLSIIFKSLNIDYKISTRKDKQNFISFRLKNSNNSLFTDKTKMKSDEVWKNDVIINTDKNNYVYDISTDDGTFIGGIGMINLKNTDGFNFSFPDNINDVKYIAKGSHWKTKNDANKELIGLDAVLAEFNENYMEGRMGLDIDDICVSTINFARKNYANLIDGKIKLVGNSIKSKKTPTYIEEFLGNAIKMLLNGDGFSFINYYYDYIDKIYNYKIPLVKIASKAKVKQSLADYKQKSKGKNKKGNPMPKQAHMELAIINNLELNLGDTIYYVNNGSSKSIGDLKSVPKNKHTKKEKDEYFKNNGKHLKVEKIVQLNCRLIDSDIVDRDFELIKELDILNKSIEVIDNESDKIGINNRIDEINQLLYVESYNVDKYLTSFNKKVNPLLVCFNKEIRDEILLDIIKIKDKKTKVVTQRLKDRNLFTKKQCELVSGTPFKETDQDSYDKLMIMEDKELKFWVKVNKIPNNIDIDDWNILKNDYIQRMIKEKEDGIFEEIQILDNMIRRLELEDLDLIMKGDLPINIRKLVKIDFDTNSLVSRTWGEKLSDINDLFKYEKEAIKRNEFYQTIKVKNNLDRYEEWLDSLNQQKILNGHNDEPEIMILPSEKIKSITNLLKKYENEVIVNTEKEIKSSNDDDSEDIYEIKYDEDIIITDDYDDTDIQSLYEGIQF
jgi:DNA polymerase elongation subunit (family B)